MDLSVIKEQLGNFKTFVDAMSDLLKNLPDALYTFGALVEGKLEVMEGNLVLFSPDKSGAVDVYKNPPAPAAK